MKALRKLRAYFYALVPIVASTGRVYAGHGQLCPVPERDFLSTESAGNTLLSLTSAASLWPTLSVWLTAFTNCRCAPSVALSAVSASR